MNYRNNVVTSTPHEDIYETVMNGGDPKPFFNEVTMTCSRGCITMLHVTPFYLVVKKESDMDFAHDGQGFPSWHRLYLLAWERTLQEIGNDEEFALPFWDCCTCWHGREPCRKLETMKNLPYLSGTGLGIPINATPQFSSKSSLA